MFGSEEVIRRIYGELYDYTLRALPDLMPMLPMYPHIRESNIGAQRGLREYAEHAPVVGPRWEEAEARAPYLVSRVSEATVALVAAEVAPADAEFAVACVGLRTDFDVDGLPEANEKQRFQCQQTSRIHCLQQFG